MKKMRTFMLGMILLFAGIFYEYAEKYITRVLRYLFVSGVCFGMIFLIALFGFGKKSNVSYNYYLYRANLIAKSVGFDEITCLGSNTPWYQIVPSGIRECLAVMKQRLFTQK